MESKKFLKALTWYNCDYSIYEPWIVAHKSSDKHLYCTLTKIVLNKIPEEVKIHFEGKTVSINSADIIIIYKFICNCNNDA
jgi:hypothetical protein